MDLLEIKSKVLKGRTFDPDIYIDIDETSWLETTEDFSLQDTTALEFESEHINKIKAWKSSSETEAFKDKDLLPGKIHVNNQ